MTKFTLYKAFSSKVATGQGYVIRRYSQKGGSPPYTLNVTIDVTSRPHRPCQKEVRLHPLPTIFPDIKGAQGLFSVEGGNIEVS